MLILLIVSLIRYIITQLKLSNTSYAYRNVANFVVNTI